MQINPSAANTASLRPPATAKAASLPDVNQDRLVDTFLKLTTIPGETYHEKPVADSIKS